MPLKINTGKDPEKVAPRYEVEGLPAILFLNSSGKVVHRFEGYKSAADFMKELQKARQLAKKVK